MNHPPVACLTVEKQQGHAQPKLVVRRLSLGTETGLNNLNRWQPIRLQPAVTRELNQNCNVFPKPYAMYRKYWSIHSRWIIFP